MGHNYGEETRPVRLFDIAVLLLNMRLAADNKNIGFEDAGRTVEDVLQRLNRHAHVPKSLLESLLWCANLLNEKKIFFHPARNVTFDSFLRRILPRDSFDRKYNLIERREKRG